MTTLLAATDLEWMREELADLRDVTEQHCENFLELARGDRQLAVDAIRSIAGGKTHERLRKLIASSR